MNKKELVEAVMQKVEAGTSKRVVEETLHAFMETVGQTLKKGQRIALTGFGTFESRRRPARRGQNPRTGQKIRIKASTVPAFRAGQGLKDTVAGKRKATAAKKSTAKSTAKKSTAKKATAKKATAKKSAQQSTARKTTAKKTAAKKATAKKSTARKTAAKKS